MLALLLLADSYLPIRTYAAYCPGRRLTVEGPFRERYVWLLSEELWRNGLPHLIYRNNICQFGWGGNELYGLFAHADDFQLNTDWKLTSDVGSGFTIDEVDFPPPPRLARLLAESEAKYGPFPERTASGKRIYGPDRRFYEDCELFKAAILPESAFAAKATGGEPKP